MLRLGTSLNLDPGPGYYCQLDKTESGGEKLCNFATSRKREPTTFLRNHQDAIAAILVYVVAYMLMNVGVFAVIIFMANSESAHEELDDFAGLASRKPGMAALLAILLLSLTGIPPHPGIHRKIPHF